MDKLNEHVEGEVNRIMGDYQLTTTQRWEAMRDLSAHIEVLADDLREAIRAEAKRLADAGGDGVVPLTGGVAAKRRVVTTEG